MSHSGVSWWTRNVQWWWHSVKQLWSCSSTTWTNAVKTVYFLSSQHARHTHFYTNRWWQGLVMKDKIPENCLYIANNKGFHLVLICLQIFYLSRCSISLSNQQMFSIYLYPTSECFLFIYIQPANVSSFPSIMFLVTRLEAHLTSYKLSYIYLTTFWLNLLLLHNISLQTLKYSLENIWKQDQKSIDAI